MRYRLWKLRIGLSIFGLVLAVSTLTGRSGYTVHETDQSMRHRNDYLQGDPLPNQDMVNQKIPLLTLFTTIRDLAHRKKYHLNTLKNWASMLPDLQPVLFVEDVEHELRNTSSWSYMATREGWGVQSYSKTLDGVPVLKEMFAEAYKGDVVTSFYGYANADILFSRSLLDTLQSLLGYVSGAVARNGTMIMGRRKNLPNKLLDLVAQPYKPEQVEILTKDKKHFIDLSADYFITTLHGFPWDKTPDFVVGRRTYDSWLLQKSIEWKLLDVDASKTILAAHQTGEDGNHAGETTQINTDINRNMMDHSKINYRIARHGCSAYLTKFETDTRGRPNSNVQLVRRPQQLRTRYCGMEL